MLNLKLVRAFYEVPIIKKILETRFHIFIVVGMINTIFSYSLFALFIYLGMHYTFAVLISSCLGVLFNFKTTGKFVFQNKNNKLIFRFVMIYVVVYFLNIGLIKFFHSLYPNYYVAGALSTLIMPIVSFTLMRLFVFRGKV